MNEILHILLVEDNPGDEDFIREILPETGQVSFAIECVPRLSEALTRLRSGGIEVILLDLNLPDCKGLDTFRKSRGAVPYIPIIVLTGINDEETAVAAVREGAQDYLIKGQVIGNILVRAIRYALERKNVEKSLRESEEKLKTLFEIVPMGVSVLGAERKFLYVNPALERILDISREGLFRGDYKNRTYLRPDGTLMPAEEYASIRAIKEQREVHNVETGIVKENGTVIWTSVSAVPVAFSDWRVVIVTSDITERKRIEQMVLQSEKMASIGTLAAGVAHEINNPIGYIYSNLKTMENYAETLQKHLDTTKQIIIEYARKKGDNELLNTFEQLHTNFQISFYFNDMMSAIRESLEGVEKVKKIVLDLKDVSRAEKYEIKPANINEAIEKTLNIVWNELKYKAEVVKDLGQLPDIECDIQRMTQVFINILVNAAQAIEKQGKITIKTYIAHNNVCIQISDTGKGISKSDLSRIFDAFFTTKEPGQGTGLGLTIALKIIQEHKGTITVSSEVGKGTTFSILLPVEREKPIHTHKVLVVDDDEDCRLSLAKEIQFYNPAITTMTAKDGFEVGEMYNTFQPEVVILDITMPGMDGFEVCRKITSSEMDNKAKVIMITGYDGEDLKRKSFEAGAIQFLEKPIHLEKLFEILDTILS